MTVFFDAHSDVMVDVYDRRDGGASVLVGEHVPAWRQGQVGGAVCVVGGDFGAVHPLGADDPAGGCRLLIELLLAEIERSDGNLVLAARADDIEAARRGGRVVVLMALEGASPVAGGLELLDDLWRMGLRMVGLTWNRANALGCGAGVANDTGLTAAGRGLVARLNELGVALDLAHAGPRTFRDAVEASRAPVLVSHGNVRRLHDSPRNLDAGQLAMIEACDGFVGATAYPDFVGPRPCTIEHLADHVEALIDAVGIERVGVGADFVPYRWALVVEDMRSAGIDYDVGEPRFPEGFEDATRFRNLAPVLEARGYRADEIEMLAWGNLVRFLRRVEAAAG